MKDASSKTRHQRRNSQQSLYSPRLHNVRPSKQHCRRCVSDTMFARASPIIRIYSETKPCECQSEGECLGAVVGQRANCQCWWSLGGVFFFVKWAEFLSNGCDCCCCCCSCDCRFLPRGVDGSLLGLKELQGDGEANWVESVWTYRLPVSCWSIALSYTHTHTHTHTLTLNDPHLGCGKTKTKHRSVFLLQHRKQQIPFADSAAECLFTWSLS